MKNNNPIVPVVSYPNADTQKLQIISENANKSGIYLWTNLTNKKQYVGSARDLRVRLRCYYSIAHLCRNNSMLIYRALLKYGYLKFSFEILEYCEPKDLFEREKYYILLLKPAYNISQEPSSPFLGSKHSEETKAKISKSNLGKLS